MMIPTAAISKCIRHGIDEIFLYVVHSWPVFTLNVSFLHRRDRQGKRS